MLERSPALKQTLLDEVHPDKAKDIYEKAMSSEFIDSERQDQLQRNFEFEKTRIAELEKIIQVLSDEYPQMTDGEFDIMYQEAFVRLNRIIQRIKSYSDDDSDHRAFRVDFVDLDKIKSLSDYFNHNYKKNVIFGKITTGDC